MSIININKSNFENEVIKSDKKVLVDFWAPWCGPCRMLLPVIEEIAEERDDVKICKINVDDESELAANFGIMSIPTLMVFENGKMVKKSLGAKPKEDVLELIDE
jgi:thioredoxin 1